MAASTNVHGFNIGGNNNSFDQRGHFYRGVFSGNVTGMLVKQNSTPNMTVLVEHGSALLNKNTTSASVAEIKSDTSVTIDTANTSNPRIDTVVIYEDTSVAIPTVEANYWQDGAGGRFKIVSLPGTAAASPVALSDASIQTAIGAGKPWTRLADITVPTNSTTILNSNIADKRSQMGGTIPDKSVTAQNIDFTTGIWWEEIARVSASGGALDTGTFPARKYLSVSIKVVSQTNTVSHRLRFNGDTGTNYNSKYNIDFGGVVGEPSSTSYIFGSTSSDFGGIGVLNISNPTSGEKTMHYEGVTNGSTGVATIPNMVVTSGKYIGSQITRIQLYNTGTGTYAAGTEVIVRAHD